MISASSSTQNKGIDNFHNESDKLLSDKYILAKEIRDLNKTLLDSNDSINILEEELKNKSELKEKLEQYIHKFDEIQREPGLPTSKNKILNELIDKYNSDRDLRNLKETLKIDKSDFIREKQLMSENILPLTDDITRLREEIDCIKEANSEVCIERDNLKAQLKNIEDEISGLIS